MAESKSIKAASIQFGMVSIAVNLYTAVSEGNDLSFNRIHKCSGDCVTQVKQKHYCPACDKDIEYSDLAKGYQYSKKPAKFIEITDEDLKSLPLPDKDLIEISSFCKDSEIDPIYLDKAYALQPEDSAKKPFALLVQTMKAKQTSAIAKVMVRTKERNCVLRLKDGVLILQTLHNANEVKGFEAQPEVALTEKELKMAASLVDMMTGEFKPTDTLGSTYQDALAKLIEAKLEGSIPSVALTATTPTLDLMQALEESMKKVSA